MPVIVLVYNSDSDVDDAIAFIVTRSLLTTLTFLNILITSREFKFLKNRIEME